MNEIIFTLGKEEHIPSVVTNCESTLIGDLIQNEEIIRINKDGFFYKGERVDDVHNVYERFNEWLLKANT